MSNDRGMRIRVIQESTEKVMSWKASSSHSVWACLHVNEAETKNKSKYCSKHGHHEAPRKNQFALQANDAYFE